MHITLNVNLASKKKTKKEIKLMDKETMKQIVDQRSCKRHPNKDYMHLSIYLNMHLSTSEKIQQLEEELILYTNQKMLFRHEIRWYTVPKI